MYIVLLACATSGCASLRQSDALCGEMIRFANATTSGTEQSVQFTTDWGGVFSDENDVFAEKRCEHGDTGPGRRLCGYLMENTSTEFAGLNINRALRCIGAPEIPEAVRAELQHAAAKFESGEVKSVNDGIVVGVEYAYGREDGPPLLRLFARRR